MEFDTFRTIKIPSIGECGVLPIFGDIIGDKSQYIGP